MKNNPYVTVFIPTYFGEDYLDDLLKQVFSQTVDFKYEVLIYDTSSKDNTPNIINNYAKKHKNLRYKTITKDDFSHGKTRQDAAQDAKGEIVVYLSQDAIPAHDRWLYEMTKPFKINQDIVAVMGSQSPRSSAFPLLKYEIKGVFSSFGPSNGITIFKKDEYVSDDEIGFMSFYSDVNSAARKSTLTGSIPYQNVPYAEDQLFGRDVINKGFAKAYAPKGEVIHSNDIKLSDYANRMFDETVGLRTVGIGVDKPSIKTVFVIILSGICKDSYRILKDRDYSLKRKVYWLLLNPLYHVQKWKGVRRGAGVQLDDKRSIESNSLEHKQERLHNNRKT